MLNQQWAHFSFEVFDLPGGKPRGGTIRSLHHVPRQEHKA
jgi:hypothetical protein